MASLWSFGKTTESSKDFFSATIFTSKPTPVIEEQDALKIPTVKAAIELIISSVSQLPIYLYVDDETEIKRITDDKRISILNHQANEYDTGLVLKKKIVQDYLLRGKAYLFKKNGKLYYLEAKNVLEENYTQDGITIAKRQFIYDGQVTVNLSEEQVLVIDSGTNGLLVDSGKLFNTALEQLNYQESLLQNGAVPVGILKATSRLTENAINRLRTSFENLYGGAKQSGKTIILEEGLDYSALSLRPDELGLHEGNKQTVSELARVFNIPESMLNSSANKYASLEQNNLQYLQNCVGPILTAIESAFDKDLLDSTEKQLGFYFRFDTAELLRTTEEQKIKTTAEAFKAGLLSFNQAVHRLDLPKVDRNYHLLSIGNVLKYEDGQLENLNLGPQLNQQEVKESNENGIPIDTNITEI